MSLFETFAVLFTADTQPLDEGAKKVDSTLDGVQNRIESADKQTQQLGNSFLGAAKNAAALLATYLSLRSAVSGIFNDVRFADQLKDVADTLDINIEELSAWGQAAKLAGGSTQEFAGTLKTMAANMTAIDVTGKSRIAPFLKELGIQMEDSAGNMRPQLDILLDIASAFETMDKKQSFGFGRKLGLDEGTIRLLQRGRVAVEDLIRRQKELGTITERQAELADQFGDAQDNLRVAMRGVGLAIAEQVLPALIGLMSGFQTVFSFLSDHHGILELIGVGISFIGVALVGSMLPGLIAATAASWAFLAPWLAIVAALTAAYAILTDIVGYFQGKDSVTGRIKGKIDGALMKRQYDYEQDLFEQGKAIPQYMQDYRAKEYLELASKTNISALGNAASISNRSSRETNVNVEQININTPATDPEAISRTIGESLERQTKQVMNNYDDGVEK